MRVLYVQYTNPGAYPPLVRGAELLAESGAAVMMLGIRIPGMDALDVAQKPGITVQLASEAQPGWRLKAHYARYAAWVLREATRWRPDWIYASDVLAAPLGLALARLAGARVVYHEHDAPSGQHQTWMIQRCLDARRRLLGRADVVVVPNAERARVVSRLAGGREVLTVWNCPRRPARRPRRLQSSNALGVIFRGSLNAERLPLTVVDAVARADAPVTLDIAGYETAGSRGYLAALAAHADRLGVADRVRALGTIPEAQLAAVCERSDLGLALMPMSSDDENMRHMTGASNKLFEYLSYGVTPLVSELPDWRETFVDVGYALACDPSRADSIAAAFSWAWKNRDDVRAISERGWDRLARDWNYESQFGPVLERMLGRALPRSPEAAVAEREEATCAS